jgi:hypothetical protein
VFASLLADKVMFHQRDTGYVHAWRAITTSYCTEEPRDLLLSTLRHESVVDIPYLAPSFGGRLLGDGKSLKRKESLATMSLEWGTPSLKATSAVW